MGPGRRGEQHLRGGGGASDSLRAAPRLHSTQGEARDRPVAAIGLRGALWRQPSVSVSTRLLARSTVWLAVIRSCVTSTPNGPRWSTLMLPGFVVACR